MADFTPTGLRVLVETAQAGSFTAAARALGYTQSAVSRQVGGAGATAGGPLFERRRDGVVLTPAGARLLRRAMRVLDELDAAARDVATPEASGPVRLGAFATAVAGLVPPALATLPPELVVTCGRAPPRADPGPAGRDARPGRARADPPFRPPDAESPPLALTVLAERELVVVVGPRHPFAGRRAVEVAELAGQVWVAGGADAPLGVWPGVAERPDVRYVVRDWWAKLQLVAAGLAITTLPPVALDALPEGVHAVAVRGEPQEARTAGARPPPRPAVRRRAAVADALRALRRPVPGAHSGMAVFKVKSKASYEGGGLEVRAKISIVVRWRDSWERRRLAAELSTYTTPREMLELEALMERYEDGETAEMRAILAAQAEGRRLAPGGARSAEPRETGRLNGSLPGTSETGPSGP